MFLISVIFSIGLVISSWMGISYASDFLKTNKKDEKETDSTRFEIYMKYTFLWGVMMMLVILCLLFFGVDWNIVTNWKLL